MHQVRQFFENGTKLIKQNSASSQLSILKNNNSRSCIDKNLPGEDSEEFVEESSARISINCSSGEQPVTGSVPGMLSQQNSCSRGPGELGSPVNDSNDNPGTIPL